VKATIQQFHFRSGEVRERIPLRDGQRHGLARRWHRNGRLVSEERYVNGRLHGICRQWNESGRLLGSYRMNRGTGIQRSWHDNGRLQTEFSTLNGEFCGRCRSWLRDGTLLADQIYLHGTLVTADEYRAAAVTNHDLPKLGRATANPAERAVTEKHIHRVFVSCLLAKPHRFEARTWLKKQRGEASAKFLGRFKREADAARFVAALYEAGATKVIAPDVHTNSKGDQFADCLLVRLPKAKAARSAIRKCCATLRKRRLGAVQPDADIGETHLFLSLA
jgi:hypothetical protein